MQFYRHDTNVNKMNINSLYKCYYNLLEEDVDLQPYCCPEPHAELRQDVEVELVAVLAGLQPQHGLAQPRVRAVEVRPGEEHGGAALQRRGRLCDIVCLHSPDMPTH